MTWTKPEFSEVTLSMEVTAYVNTDDQVVATHDAAMAVGNDADVSLLGMTAELASA